MLSLWGYVLEGDLGVGVYPNERERGRTDLTSTAFAAIKRSWLENRQRNKMQSSPSLSSSDNSPSVHAEHTDYHMLRFLEREREVFQATTVAIPQPRRAPFSPFSSAATIGLGETPFQATILFSS